MANAEADRLRDNLSQALRQWRMYAEQEPDRDLSKEESTEASLYRCLIKQTEPPKPVTNYKEIR